MTENSSSTESLESKVFEITIAHLGNSDKEVSDQDFIELNDVKLSLDLFKNCFYHNNSRFFELNHQFRNSDILNLHNKTIKYSNLKCCKNNGKLDLQDIMIYKYLKNKKTKMTDGSKLILLKELLHYTSLADFQIYHNNLSYENILSVFKNHNHKKNKKYFRFKIKIDHHSNNLDENLVLYFNFLVKIPKKNEENDEEDDVSVISEEDIFDDDILLDKHIFKNKNIEDQTLSNSNVRENIIYSNYVKNLNARITQSNLTNIETENKIEDNFSDDGLSDDNSTSGVDTNDEFF
jgi:hypothetical protein